MDLRVGATRGLETRVLALNFTQTLEPNFSKLGGPLQKLNIDSESGKRQLSSDTYHVVYLHTLCESFPSKIENEKLMWIADKYEMEQLLEKMIKELDTIQKAKQLKASDGYNELSDRAKAKILDKIMTII
ncbi:hypothetical protein CRE_10363 [Caenorhabditis remanei]|uniref:Uncharacterized protein n=1 Tax=Caenorhabditis remanei TaxID=31234 RepID=E3MQK1_CAERE|nr:hypothetical protein CRE_10363 [Caenorhabditis remanei]